MSNQQKVGENTREELVNFPKEKLLDFIEVLGRDCQTVHNQWMAYMFKEYGDEAAAKADAEVFPRFARSMLYREREILDAQGNDISTLIELYKFFPTHLSPGIISGEWIEVADRRAVLRISSCTMGRERRKSGLPLLPCKTAGLAIYQTLATIVNPEAKVRCVFCPPDEIPPDAMCQWEFEFPRP